MKFLQKISDVLDKVCGACIVVMLGLMVIFTTAQIICRTWFTSLTWSEELTRYLLIWSTFLGSTCVYRHSGNISITFVQGLVPEKGAKFLRVLVHLVCMALFIVLLIYGVQYTGKLNRSATTLPIKMSQVFRVVPVSMGICAFHAFVMLLEELFAKKEAER